MVLFHVIFCFVCNHREYSISYWRTLILCQHLVQKVILYLQIHIYIMCFVYYRTPIKMSKFSLKMITSKLSPVYSQIWSLYWKGYSFLSCPSRKRTKEIVRGTPNHQLRQIGSVGGRILKEEWREKTLVTVISDMRRLFWLFFPNF